MTVMSGSSSSLLIFCFLLEVTSDMGCFALLGSSDSAMMISCGWSNRHDDLENALYICELYLAFT